MPPAMQLLSMMLRPRNADAVCAPAADAARPQAKGIAAAYGARKIAASSRRTFIRLRAVKERCTQLLYHHADA